MTPYRVIQWATGGVGQIAIRHLAENPAFELTGAYVTSDEKEGKDAGELAGIAPLGVAATKDAGALLALEADCVNYAPLHADVDEMCRILRSGKNIVTPVGFAYPKALEPAVVTALDAACQDGATSLHGTGIHPGFTGDLLALTYARLSSRIDQIVVQEIADLRNHPSPKMLFEGLGFGRDPHQARSDPSPIIHTMDRIFLESISLLADGLGVNIERFDTDYDVAVATRDLQLRSGEIAAGRVAGMRFEWQAWSGGKPVIVFRSFWKMDDDVDPDWGFENSKYSLEFHGLPSFKVNFEPSEPGPGGDVGFWGRMWTAMSAVNAIPAVCEAPPGICTHLDLKPVRPPMLFR